MKIILLLHGATGSSEDMLPLSQALQDGYTVYSLNFYGHDGTSVEDEFSIEKFASQVIDWMEEKAIEKITVAGYSLGGYVGLYLALNYPPKIEKVITISTKFYWDQSVAENQVSGLDPNLIIEKFPLFAHKLQRLHKVENWANVLNKTAQMLRHMGRFNPLKFEDFKTIAAPVLLVLGDRDKMVSFVETTTVFKELPNAQLSILPNTPHDLAEADIPLLSLIIQSFVNG